MKKVARMRLSPNNINEEMINITQSHNSNNEPVVRTTGRIKKPKAVFDPSDNYLPRAQRSLITGTTSGIHHNTISTSLERRTSYSKVSAFVSPVAPSIIPESKDACTICKKKESKRPVFASKNPLISCVECQRKIHKLCLKVDFEDFETVLRNYKCERCITCPICNDTFNNLEEMITCSKCRICFHLVCFPTNITENLRKWKCNKCQVYNQMTNGTTLPVKKIREIIGGGEPLTNTTIKRTYSTSDKNSSEEKSSFDSTADNTSSSSQKRSIVKVNETNKNESSPLPEKRLKSSQSPDTISVETTSLNTQFKSSSTVLCYTPNESFDDTPNVKQWSVDQVYDYFYKHFPREAHVFKDEDIDGRCLLLLKRSDVVKKFPFKLGQSLRIYSRILKLQAQLTDHSIGWNCSL